MKKKLTDFNTVSLIAEQYQSFVEKDEDWYEKDDPSGLDISQGTTGADREEGATQWRAESLTKELKELTAKLRDPATTPEDKIALRTEIHELSRLVQKLRGQGKFPQGDTEAGKSFPRSGIEVHPKDQAPYKL
jgi:hypothetical protein